MIGHTSTGLRALSACTSSFLSLFGPHRFLCIEQLTVGYTTLHIFLLFSTVCWPSLLYMYRAVIGWAHIYRRKDTLYFFLCFPTSFSPSLCYMCKQVIGRAHVYWTKVIFYFLLSFFTSFCLQSYYAYRGHLPWVIAHIVKKKSLEYRFGNVKAFQAFLTVKPINPLIALLKYHSFDANDPFRDF